MGYIHVEVEAAQISRHVGAPCGDLMDYDRTPTSTTIVVSDGIGHGVKAHIYAEMCVSRILELLRQGYSLRKAFANVVRTMDQARGSDLPYAVFTVVRILNDGVTTVLSYEMPPPIFISPRYANVLPQRTITLENVLVGEANCHVAPGEGIIVVTDGITQAGLGQGLPSGWTIEGTNQYVRDCLIEGVKQWELPKYVLAQARKVWGKIQGDDCSVILASCRWGKTVNILTGPPADPKNDRAVTQKFLQTEGTKVVCGGTTSQMVAKCLDTQVVMEPSSESMLTPPKCRIDGIDLVTEGAVTLNQVYNVLGTDPSRFDEESAVTELHELLMSADRVNIFMGAAINPATAHISFQQKGILTRHAIVPLIAQKMREQGKLVVVEEM